MKIEIEVWFDAQGNLNGESGQSNGCYRAHLRIAEVVAAAAATPEEAVTALLSAAEKRGYSSNLDDYEVKNVNF